MKKAIKKLGILAYATLVGAVYRPPILDIDINTVNDNELSDKIRESIGSDNVVIVERHFSRPRFPWESARPQQETYSVAEAVNYFFQEAVQADLFPLTQMRVHPVQYRWGKKGFTIVADTEIVGRNKIIHNAIGMDVKPVYKS